MEISIKWNVCRVCLVEERRNHTAKYIPIDTKIAKQIYDIAGVKTDSTDNLPDKICRKCFLLLKHACHFSTTCRNSDEYLQSIIRKTKSATAMLKLDKHRERTAEIMDEIFNEDSELVSITLEDEEPQPEDSTMDVDFDKADVILPNSKTLPERIGDSRDESQLFQTQLIRTVADSSSVMEIQEQTNDNGPITNYFIRHENITQTIKNTTNSNKLNKEENVDHALIEEDYESNELVDFDDKGTNYNNQRNHNRSECSIEDLAYTDDAEERVETFEYNSNDNNQVNDLETTTNVKLEDNNEESVDNENIHSNEADTSDLFYIIKVEEPVVKADDSQDVCVATNSNDEAEDIPLISDLTGTESCEDGMESIDENSQINRSMAQLEEYLIDESDTETIIQHELQISEHKQEATKRPSATTIKIKERERRSSPNIRKGLNNGFMFTCDVCGNHFTSRSLRNYHMRIHRNERNFECELCFKRFTAACNLTAHMRIHTGEKPYECKYCLRRFTDRSTHIKHERIHTNEKPFQCNICSKSFSLSTTLRTHEKVHTNEKPFKCSPCNKSFKLPHQLKSHLHTNQHKNVLMANDLV